MAFHMLVLRHLGGFWYVAYLSTIFVVANCCVFLGWCVSSFLVSVPTEYNSGAMIIIDYSYEYVFKPPRIKYCSSYASIYLFLSLQRVILVKNTNEEVRNKVYHTGVIF